MLAAPDIDLSVFREQLSHVDPHHISVLVSSKDKALSLSSWLAGDRPRLGALDPHKPSDRAALRRLGVKVYNLAPESSGFIGHGMYADVPAVVRSIGMQIGEARLQDENVQAVLGKNPIDPGVTSTPLPAAAPSAPPAGAATGTPAPLGSAPTSPMSAAPAPVVSAAPTAPAAPPVPAASVGASPATAPVVPVSPPAAVPAR
jgi:hypothetical protein